MTSECSRMHIESRPPPVRSRFSSRSLLRSSLLFHSTRPRPSFFHTPIRLFYPEAELGSCYNLTSTFLSAVTAAFARMRTPAKPDISFILFSRRAQGGFSPLIPHDDNHRIFFSFFFPDRIMRQKRRRRKKKSCEKVERANESMTP